MKDWTMLQILMLLHVYSVVLAEYCTADSMPSVKFCNAGYEINKNLVYVNGSGIIDEAIIGMKACVCEVTQKGNKTSLIVESSSNYYCGVELRIQDSFQGEHVVRFETLSPGTNIIEEIANFSIYMYVYNHYRSLFSPSFCFKIAENTGSNFTISCNDFLPTTTWSPRYPTAAQSSRPTTVVSSAKLKSFPPSLRPRTIVSSQSSSTTASSPMPTTFASSPIPTGMELSPRSTSASWSSTPTTVASSSRSSTKTLLSTQNTIELSSKPTKETSISKTTSTEPMSPLTQAQSLRPTTTDSSQRSSLTGSSPVPTGMALSPRSTSAALSSRSTTVASSSRTTTNTLPSTPNKIEPSPTPTKETAISKTTSTEPISPLTQAPLLRPTTISSSQRPSITALTQMPITFASSHIPTEMASKPESTSAALSLKSTTVASSSRSTTKTFLSTPTSIAPSSKPTKETLIGTTTSTKPISPFTQAPKPDETTNGKDGMENSTMVPYVAKDGKSMNIDSWKLIAAVVAGVVGGILVCVLTIVVIWYTRRMKKDTWKSICVNELDTSDDIMTENPEYGQLVTSTKYVAHFKVERTGDLYAVVNKGYKSNEVSADFLHIQAGENGEMYAVVKDLNTQEIQNGGESRGESERSTTKTGTIQHNATFGAAASLQHSNRTMDNIDPRQHVTMNQTTEDYEEVSFFDEH